MAKKPTTTKRTRMISTQDARQGEIDTRVAETELEARVRRLGFESIEKLVSYHEERRTRA